MIASVTKIMEYLVLCQGPSTLYDQDVTTQDMLSLSIGLLSPLKLSRLGITLYCSRYGTQQDRKRWVAKHCINI